MLTAASAALVLAAAPAFAAGDEDNSEGFYLGVGLGEFSTQIDDIDNVDDVDLDFDADEDATKIFAGWRFNRFFAVQLDQYDFDQSNLAVNLIDVSSNTKGTAASVVGTLPLGPVELFARIGEIWYDVNVDVDGEREIDSSGNDPVYSAGIGFTVLKRLNLKAEYERIKISDFSDANAVWLSADWRF
jgi:hypothetical protein